MDVVVVGQGYSALAMLSALRRFVTSVRVVSVVLDADTARAARSVSSLCGLPVKAAEGSGTTLDLRDGVHDGVLSFFWDDDREFESDGFCVRISAVDGSVRRSADPLPWALAAGSEALTLAIERSPGIAGPHSRCSHSLVLPATGGLQNTADAATLMLETCLGPVCGSTATGSIPTHDPLQRRSPLPRLVLPSRLNWSTPTDRLVNLIRAYGPPAPGAWTEWHGVQLFVSSAARANDSGGPVLPGTVLERSATEILVATVDGAIRMSELRDIIGPVDAHRFTPGTVLGTNFDQDIVRLEQRVRDLETVVRRLADGISFL